MAYCDDCKGVGQTGLRLCPDCKAEIYGSTAFCAKCAEKRNVCQSCGMDLPRLIGGSGSLTIQMGEITAVIDSNTLPRQDFDLVLGHAEADDPEGMTIQMGEITERVKPVICPRPMEPTERPKPVTCPLLKPRGDDDSKDKSKGE